MITENPALRRKLLEEVSALVVAEVPKEEASAASLFAVLCFSDMPDRTALTFPPDLSARLILDHYRFFRHAVPPAWQVYKGYPGIHVEVYNPAGEECYMTCGPGESFETTVVRIHTIDGPFIFDSLRNYFRKAGIMVYSAIHPIVGVVREKGEIAGLALPAESVNRELFIHFTIEKIVNADRRAMISEEIFSVLKALFLGVEDFSAMLGMAKDIVTRAEEGQQCAGVMGEPCCAFINWLRADNFIFMGMIRYAMDDRQGLVSDHVSDVALGVFREPALVPMVFPGLMEELHARLMPEESDSRIIDIDYCGNTSAIYHLEPVDYVAVRERRPNGTVQGVTVILGRFAVGAMFQKSADVPLLRDKLEWILARSGASREAFYYRETRRLFGLLPKRELFYADVESLKAFIDAVVFMTSDDEVVVASRRGGGGRYQVLYLAFSHARFTHQVEKRILKEISEKVGTVEFHTDTELGTVEVLILYLDGRWMHGPVFLDDIRHMVEDALTTWDDRVIGYLTRRLGEHEGFSAYHRNLPMFSSFYREVTPADEVPDDLSRMEALRDAVLARVHPLSQATAVLKLYSPHSLTLMDILPTLKNLGLTVVDEVKVVLAGQGEGNGDVYLYRFSLEMDPGRLSLLVTGEERVEDAIARIVAGEMCDDEMGGLVVTAGLIWREIELLRAVRNHFLQIRQTYNVATINETLLHYPTAASAMAGYFSARFGLLPEGEDRETLVGQAERVVNKAIDEVRSLSEDEILQGLFNLMQAAVRTNFFLLDRSVISIKILCGRVDSMPSPRPMAEIFVHSPRLSGIHLRGGMVARGGIRWSDRPDDFRTEVLGLMKTQMVKNSIIVPVGSKGGFVLKGSAPGVGREYLRERYKEYISGLLDITDNIVVGRTVHPDGVVVHDVADPYLVVAADKGTAHLSDEANDMAARYGFWLGDAFASGGSRGYDHKKVGITARGAWVCAQRHFREMGIDPQIQEFTAIGIGDMGGDVFGNGMLRSDRIRLVAAFNHVHIFLDPDPAPTSSYRERERLFLLPGTTWKDYDTSLISPGGGVFDRSAKSIPLSREARRALGVREEALSGEELIRRILTMEVDLLYNGGIGTYIKAVTESHGEVGDRVNDRVRVNGADVRARIIVEGGNLGMTQKGRLEYWARGGRCNTDAVDNSGGVDLSDHEVNIKILLDILVARGELGREERNRLLAAMTEEVAGLVLMDNYLQSQALSLDMLRSAERAPEFFEIIRSMKRSGILYPQDESIPSQEELTKLLKKKKGLPRPMIAVLIGYQKMWAYHRILESGLPDSPVAETFMVDYFPQTIKERFGRQFKSHPLRREIAATVMVNRVVNHAGTTFFSRVEKATGKKWAEILEVYLTVEGTCGARGLREKIYGMDNLVPAHDQYALLLAVEEKLEAMTLRLLSGQGATVFPEELAVIREKVRALSAVH